MAAVWQRTAKRAPKLSCCRSISSIISKIETKPINPTDVNDSFHLPIFSDSKRWLQLQPDNMYQRGLTSNQVNAQDDGSISIINSLSSKESYEVVNMDSVEIPWWQVVETDDLGSFVSKKSCILIESCDLYRPKHTGLETRKVECGQTPVSRGGSVECGQTPVSRGESQHDTSKRKILEALCHSQTRAREAEIAVKKVYEEKEHAIKLLFRQAAQLFAYRQWIYGLQVENLCYQMKNNYDSVSKVGKLDKNRKTVVAAKGKRTRTRRGFGLYKHDLGKYMLVFVVGFGIVGAGLLLGWTVGWMLI